MKVAIFDAKFGIIRANVEITEVVQDTKELLCARYYLDLVGRFWYYDGEQLHYLTKVEG